MKKRKFLTLLAVLGLLAATTLGGAFTAAGADWSFAVSGELADSYLVGETVSLPAGTFTRGGSEYAAETVVVFPDGRAYNADGSVTLTQSGMYRVDYRAVAGTSLVTESLSFRADDTMFTYTGLGGSISYGVDTSAYETGLTGLTVQLGIGGTLRYNRIIDINDIAAGTPYIRALLLPAVQGTPDARQLIFTLTDAYDPDNYVNIKLQSVEITSEEWTSANSYMMAAAAGQPYVGLEGSKVHVNNEYGAYINYSMGGHTSETYPESTHGVGKRQIGFYIDTAAKTVYGTVNTSSRLVCDLDDKAYMTTLWNGFTTGEVYLSVTADSFNGNTATLMITEIAGEPVPDNTAFVDDEKPVITVDTEGNDAIPAAVVGRPYPLFAATAADRYSGACDVSVRVYGCYGTTAEYELDALNGTFTPDRAGGFTVIYTASDTAGNEASARIDITACAARIPMLIALGEAPDSGSVGTAVTVASATVSGGHGSPRVEVTARCGDRTTDVVNGSFIPETDGQYTITYTATDRLGYTDETNYTIAVAPAEAPIFQGEPELPAYFIAGRRYVLAPYTAIDYDDGKKVVEASVTITDAAETNDYTGIYTPTAGGENMTTLVYRAGGASATYTRPVVDVGNDSGGIDMRKYFVTDNLTLEALDREMRMTTSGGGSATFINALYGEGFNAEFRSDDALAGLSSVDITLTDALDDSAALTLSFTAGTFSIDGVMTALTAAEVTSGGAYIFRYSSGTVTMGTGETVAVSDYSDFAGFPSGRVMCEITLNGSGSIRLSTINGQRFSSSDRDAVWPDILIYGSYGSSAQFGSEVTVFAAMSMDVLDPYTEGSVSVYYDGAPVTADDGTVLSEVPFDREYTFTADRYGSYTVTYSAADSNGLSQPYSYTINVPDTVAPEITLSGTVPETAAYGSRVTLPAATATDNVDGAAEVFVYVFGPDQSVIFADGSFEANRRGRYSVRYLAMDAAGNIAIAEYTITVG